MGGRVSLPAGKAVIASKLNLTPETFSRELHRLGSLDLIRVHRDFVEIVDIGALTNAFG